MTDKMENDKKSREFWKFWDVLFTSGLLSFLSKAKKPIMTIRSLNNCYGKFASVYLRQV